MGNGEEPKASGDHGTPSRAGIRFIGRYALLGKLASGGMATVHVGRLLGPVGFTRTVAIKRLHPEYARDPPFVSMFLDEARLAAQISHPNVVATLDVVATGGELFLVMDYVHGQSLSWLIKNGIKTGKRIPPRIAASIVSGALQGLHAAHEARDERGIPLDIVHRDVSPQNVIIGADGLARVLDFGVAKAVGRIQNTREEHLKGKLAYMPPEQIQTDSVSRLADVYAAAVILWEALTGARLFKGETEAATLARILSGPVTPPSKLAPEVPPALDRVVMKGLARNPRERYATAREMAIEIERSAGVASNAEVSAWLESVSKKELDDRAARIAAIEMTAGLSSPREIERLAETLTAAHLDAIPRSLPTLGGDVHSGESASQLSSVSLALGRPPQAPESAARNRMALAMGTLLGAAVVGAGLWVSVAPRGDAGSTSTAPATISARSPATAVRSADTSTPPVGTFDPATESVTPEARDAGAAPTKAAPPIRRPLRKGVPAPKPDKPSSPFDQLGERD